MEINKETMLAIIKELYRVTSELRVRTQDNIEYLEGTCDAYDGLIKMLERIQPDGNN